MPFRVLSIRSTTKNLWQAPMGNSVFWYRCLFYFIVFFFNSKCSSLGVDAKVLCEENRCIVDADLLEELHLQNYYLGWRATNQSKFWGRTLEDGVKLRLGTLNPGKSVSFVSFKFPTQAADFRPIFFEEFSLVMIKMSFSFYKVYRMNPVRRMYNPDSLPKEFDSRREWPRFISDIRDQGWCGASWALSTVDVTTDRYAIMSKGAETVELSAQHLLSCNNRGQQGCNGGYLDRAWMFLKKFG